MSTKKEQFVPAAMERLKMALNLDSDASLARRLNVQPVLISRWKMREKKNIDKIEIISAAAKESGINLHWLFTGEGSMHMDPAKEPSLSKDDEELLELFHSANKDIRAAAVAVLRSQAVADGVKKRKGAA